MPMNTSDAASARARMRLRDARHAIRQMIAITSHQGSRTRVVSTWRSTTSITPFRVSNALPKFCTRNFRASLVHSRSGI